MQLFSVDINKIRYHLSFGKSYIVTYRTSDNIFTDMACQLVGKDEDCLIFKNNKKIAIALIEKIMEL